MLREEGKYLAGKLMLSQMEKAANAAVARGASGAWADVVAAAVCCCN